MIGEPPKKPPLAITGYLALIPLVVGIGMLCSSLYDITTTRRLELGSLTATGMIVGEVRNETARGYMYCPIVRFKPAIGLTVQFKDSSCAGVPHERPDGAHVVVRYRADAPAESAAVAQGQSGYWISAFTGGAGLLSILLAIGVMRRLRRARLVFEVKQAASKASERDPKAPTTLTRNMRGGK